MKKKTFDVLLYCLKGYLFFLVAVVPLQREMVYHPAANWIAAPEVYGAQAVRYKSADGIDLASWYAPPKEGKPVIAMFHGNAANISHRAYKMDYFVKQGYGFLLVEYRGYSGLAGRPTEEGLYNDARAALEWLITEKSVAEHDIILYGESIGSGVASQMALEHKGVKALIFEAPLRSVPDVGKSKMPWLYPVMFLTLDVFDNMAKAPYFKMPLLIVQGTEDEVIPVHHGKDLYAVAGSKKKELVILEGGKHNDLANYGMFLHMGRFLEELSG